eukprot:TRINITY_DN293_c0_g1_i1.p1 TRINITY_DN293_c0_g1~~TRINITY_DN293_c0_g1_i1.p1  ORF type:complete len:206 (+),score=16.96 TRINITY_DN293_c0_g1_i1:83-619(+)
MGNCHVFLRFYNHKTEEPLFTQIELGEHIKWHDMQQHAFNEFKPYYNAGVDPSKITFTTVLDTSNRELAIDDGETLRGLFDSFLKQEAGGHLAVLDVHVPGHEQNKVAKEKMMEKKVLLQEIKANMHHQQHKKGKKEVKEVIIEQEWEKYYTQHKDRMKPENKTVIMVEFQEQIRQIN